METNEIVIKIQEILEERGTVELSYEVSMDTQISRLSIAMTPDDDGIPMIWSYGYDANVSHEDTNLVQVDEALKYFVEEIEMLITWDVELDEILRDLSEYGIWVSV